MRVLHETALLAGGSRPATGGAPRGTGAEGLDAVLPDAEWDMRDLREPLPPPVELAVAAAILALLTLFSPWF